MAQLPVPRRPGPEPVLTDLGDGSAWAIPSLPDAPRDVLRTLHEAGHEAALVGGCLRDLLLGHEPGDWDVATAAPPETVHALFSGSWWANRFGTVTIPGPQPVQITTYRTEWGYRDRRRPDEVVFHGSLADDLARRDFTINAIAWLPDDPATSVTGRLVDPHGGVADLRAGVIRAVGDPGERLREDALRILRAVRFAARFDFEIEPATAAALTENAGHVAELSAERVRDELLRLLADPVIRPSAALARWEEIGILEILLPELAALRGVAQGKPLPGDALDHSLRTADVLPPDDPILRLAGLLHDVGKAPTEADGHFIGHERVGATLAGAVMRRLRFGSPEIARVERLVRHHMFGYDATWTDAAVRRFIRRVGADLLDDLFALRAADNAASGVVEPEVGGLDELRRRTEAERAAPAVGGGLAIDGTVLQQALDIPPGPEIGRLLDRLTEAVIDDPRLNEPERLVALARALHAGQDRTR
ncbi:MAG TPA: CCA tRNA nucleotidyltransferase [Candidatus Limnocylindria bacterium]|nr:CCA tRNA nucleotidyltransferase [Candidatus Limnocylindria bacterium]